ncbi:uncharacterized protein [Blastocystis hominis]|uniref:Uncharacterized protein n=1 Tax=Blastocystis hominis TaxID=12968 RepID=D8M8D4_BLAHO|nr:uncharacterized protein [Blastocystis hominis]CBK24323.2 unnamed protein product [Blastocystis hominis]|eukprot:XP_012898371.1 uncharacterized protein [Blastocystis hominis]
MVFVSRNTTKLIAFLVIGMALVVVSSSFCLKRCKNGISCHDPAFLLDRTTDLIQFIEANGWSASCYIGFGGDEVCRLLRNDLHSDSRSCTPWKVV